MKVIETIAAQWEELAIALEFEAPVINYLSKDFKHDSKGAAKKVLEIWLKGESNLDKPITWDTLIQCLSNAEQYGLAKDLEEIFEWKDDYMHMDLLSLDLWGR